MAKKNDTKERSEDFKYIVRIANTDIPGEVAVKIGLTNIKGIGTRLATVISDSINIEREKLMGDLSDDEVTAIEKYISQLPEKVPGWMLNRRRDFDSGQDKHYYGAELPVRIKDDINFMKKIRSYRGIRHETHHKVRGQRTRSNGRHGMTMGVSKKRSK